MTLYVLRSYVIM